MKQRLAILGSTGSIGVQTLDIVAENPDLFEVTSLVAGRNWELLARQAIEFEVDSVCVPVKMGYIYNPTTKFSYALFQVGVSF